MRAKRSRIRSIHRFFTANNSRRTCIRVKTLRNKILRSTIFYQVFLLYFRGKRSTHNTFCALQNDLGERKIMYTLACIRTKRVGPMVKLYKRLRENTHVREKYRSRVEKKKKKKIGVKCSMVLFFLRLSIRCERKSK